MRSGDILHYDFRESKRKPFSHPAPIRIIQWNIERGYQLQKIIDILGNLDGDILCLQEIDIHCERSSWVDVGVEIAKALKLNYYFLCEFEEIYSSIRSKDCQGGGFHGNGIFTKFDIEEVHTVYHRLEAFDWEAQGHIKHEPRKGKRCQLAATILIPHLDDIVSELEGEREPRQLRLLCYSVHLEVFCGILGRIAQISDVLEDARRCSLLSPMQVICGDLNTMAHGIARLSPSYCCDHLRWRSLGQSESQWWQWHLWDFHDELGPFNRRLRFFVLSKKVLERARNPGFYDPFDLQTDITLQSKSYYGLFQGKLDWILLRGDSLRVKRSFLENHDYSASDHKLLCVEVEILSRQQSKDFHDQSTQRKGSHIHEHRRDLCIRNLWALIAFALLLAFMLFSDTSMMSSFL